MPYRFVSPPYKWRDETECGWIANLPDDSLPQMVDVTPPGVYFGYARVSACRSDNQVDGPSSGPLKEEQTKVHPMVMSLGTNPFYKNENLTAVGHSITLPFRRARRENMAPNRPSPVCPGVQEIHIMHPFDADFYGHEMKAVVLGYIRPELDYTTRGTHQRWSPNDDQFLT